jgi:hypothetical protein
MAASKKLPFPFFLTQFKKKEYLTKLVSGTIYKLVLSFRALLDFTMRSFL